MRKSDCVYDWSSVSVPWSRMRVKIDLTRPSTRQRNDNPADNSTTNRCLRTRTSRTYLLTKAVECKWIRRRRKIRVRRRWNWRGWTWRRRFVIWRGADFPDVISLDWVRLELLLVASFDGLGRLSAEKYQMVFMSRWSTLRRCHCCCGSCSLVFYFHWI